MTKDTVFGAEPTNEVEAVETVAKPKRVRKAPVKVQKTAGDIILEIEGLTKEVNELENALNGLSSDNVAFAIVKKAYDEKRAAYDKALTHVYTA